MYWYYKAIFIVIAVLLLGGIVYGLRGFIPTSMPGWFDKKQEVSVPDPDPPPPPPPVSVGNTERLPADGGSVTASEPPTPAAEPMPTDPYSLQVAERIALAQRHVQDNKAMVARGLLDSLLRDPELKPYSPYWYKAAEIIGDINTQIIFSDIPVPEKVTHIVKRGDTVWGIAKQYGETMSMVMRGNNINPSKPSLHPGQVLKIYDAEWAIDVSKTHSVLVLKDGPRLFKIYRIGIGRQDRTPVGTFKIDTKESEPIWTYAGKKYAYGDPANVLGTRWMGLTSVGTTNPLFEGYGIHGTWEPDSIGKARSNGCVRMLNEQVEELFDIVPYGTQVVIHE